MKFIICLLILFSQISLAQELNYPAKKLTQSTKILGILKILKTTKMKYRDEISLGLSNGNTMTGVLEKINNSLVVLKTKTERMTKGKDIWRVHYIPIGRIISISQEALAK